VHLWRVLLTEAPLYCGPSKWKNANLPFAEKLIVNNNCRILPVMRSGSCLLKGLPVINIKLGSYIMKSLILMGFMSPILVLGQGVGIGTSAPSALLDIEYNDVDVAIEYTETGGISWHTGIDFSNGNAFSIGHSATVGTNSDITILTSGFVGIGTSNPQHDFVIYDDASNSSVLLFQNSTTGNTNGDGFYVGLGGGENAYLWHYENDYMSIGTNDVERIRINADGKVGIGTSNPNHDLVIYDDASGSAVCLFQNSTTGNTSGDGFYVGLGSGENAYLWHYENDYMSIGTNDVERIRINADGKVGIGTSNPQHDLIIYDDAGGSAVCLFQNSTSGSTNRDGFYVGLGGSGNAYLHHYENDFISIGTNDLERMRINANGDVGIGRISTGNPLEVEGDASKTTATAWAANSDRRIKTDIKDIEDAYKTILQLRPVAFRYTDEWMKIHPVIKDKVYYNFIAQEYQEVFPLSVKGSGEYLPGDEEEILQVDPYNSQIVTIKAVQELILENKKQQETIETFEAELKEMRTTEEKAMGKLKEANNLLNYKLSELEKSVNAILQTCQNTTSTSTDQ